MSESTSWLRRPGTWVLAITLFAGLARLTYIDWDQHHFFHPDERRIAYAVQDLSFKPLQLNPKFFAYGSFPIYLTKITTSLLSLVDPRMGGYDNAVYVARVLSGVIGTLTVLLLIFLGTRLYDRSVGLLAGFLLAACVLHAQNSKFGTVDVTLTFLVLLALYFLVGVVRRGKLRDYLYAGIAIGFAGATKASAFPLMLPLAVAAAYRWRAGDRFGKIALQVLAASAAVFAAFAVGQPYALLDFKAFTHDLFEQSNMVRHAGLFPYTNQYVGAPKYAYDITQMVLWGMAPPLGLAAVWASGRRVLGVLHERAEEIVLLAWVVPFFLVTGWFEVKFIRYLLPIYPLMILWAAEWLVRVSRRRGLLARMALPTVAGATFLALLAFLSIYTRPHTAVTGSEWVYKFIPAGSKILSQDWDEGFPMPLPGGFNPDRYKIVTFGYYEPDNSAKMRKLANQLADSDYIAFQTKRLYGALTQADQKYPLSSNYFYLLFAGDLGYTLTHEVASRPSLFGIEVPDELADESLSVYDHPKILIFRNDGHLSADALYDKIMHGLPSKQMTRSDLLLAHPGAEVGGAASEPIRSSLPALLTFAVLVEALGLFVYPLLRQWLAGCSPYALSKILGVLLFAYVPWLLISLGEANFTRGTLALTILLIAGVGGAAWLRWRRGERTGPATTLYNRTELIASESLFWGVFLFFLVVRAFNPEIYWGEKPMDFSFLNALNRSTHLPPPEPWFSGSDLNYSYFGHYITAALGKVCHIDPAITFNLAIALFAGMTAVGAFALGYAMTRRWRVGVLTVGLTILLGNLAGPRELIHRGRMNFDYFWATSRVIKDTINEFPLWSYLFADLHAHVMVMPFALAFLCLAVAWTRQQFRTSAEERSAPAALLAVLGLTLGTIMVTNTWSLFTYMPFFIFLLACHWLAGGPRRAAAAEPRPVLVETPDPPAAAQPDGLAVNDPSPAVGEAAADEAAVALPVDSSAPAPAERPPDRRSIATFAMQLVTRVLAPAVAVVLLAYVLYLPYWLHWNAPERNIGLERGPYARWQDFLTIFGLFLYVLIPWLFLLWRRRLLPPRAAAEKPRLGPFRTVLLLIVVIGLAGSLFISTRAFLLILAILALQLATLRWTSPRYRIPLAMASFAFFVTAGCEIIYVWDRMNTIFKFYLDSWFLFAAAAAAAASDLWRGRLVYGPMRRAWQAGFVVLLAVAAFTSGSDTYGILTTNRVQTPKPTLNGMLYLESHAPYELAAYNWLNQHISGIPVILEAYGPSYQEYARVSMNTGLPTVLGWDYHVYQRAHSHSDIERRKVDIKLMYTSGNKDQVRAALERYHVALVFVGALERRTYPELSLQRLKSWTDLLTPLYENAGVTVFAVNGIFTGAIPVTTIEEVPHVTSEEAAAPRQDAEGMFHQPRGVATDSTGAIYACDFGNNRIQKLNAQLQFQAAWGSRGDLPGQFKDPCGIAIGPQDTVYVADTWNQRVQVFTASGQFVREWGASFYGPRGIAVDQQGTVFVADTGNSQIKRFSSTGQQQLVWGGAGKEPGKLKEPVGIAVDRHGRIYVCDNGNARVQIFTRDGAFVGGFPVPGWEIKVYSEPYIAVDPSGTIWVTVPLAKEVRAYSASGQLLRTVTGQAIATAHFDTPMGITVDQKAKQLVVTDLENRIVRFPYGEGR
jgi:YYY domain-containing protein